MINIYTDASFCDGIAGWAFVIEGDIPKLSNGNFTVSNCKFDTPHKACGVTIAGCPIEAELIAIKMATSAILDRDQTMILYHSDCLHAVNMLMRQNRSYRHDKYLNAIIKMLHKNQFSYWFNYVPRNSTERMLWCDQQAKEQLI